MRRVPAGSQSPSCPSGTTEMYSAASVAPASSRGPGCGSRERVRVRVGARVAASRVAVPPLEPLAAKRAKVDEANAKKTTTSELKNAKAAKGTKSIASFFGAKKKK